MFKKVRNYFVLCAVAVLSMLAFAACGDDDDDEPQSGGKNSIVGEWRCTYEKWWDKEDGKIVDSGERTYNGTEYILKFGSDGTAYAWEGGSGETARWSLSGTKLTLSFVDEDGIQETQVATCKISGNTMTIVSTEKEEENGHTYEYYTEMTFKRIVN